MEKFPSVLAVQQLAAITSDKAIPELARIQAAKVLLRIANGEPRP